VPEPSALTEVLKLQAAACAALGSPFSAALLERAAEAAPTEAALRGVFQPWAESSRRGLLEDAVALRWLGALHDVVLSEPESDLARVYPLPDRAGAPDRAWLLALARIRHSPERIGDFMRHEPQTNEVRRSAVLLPGFLVIAAQTRLPLRILELGASAGLNQLWDRRRYRFGAVSEWGPRDAKVTLETDWRGGPPPTSCAVDVVERSACDRSPVDLGDPAQRRRLRAFIWPDQFDRLDRLDAAIAETLAAGVTVEREDAPVWARRHGEPRAGLATVVFHSVFFQYMPAPSQEALVATLAEFGSRADEGAPLAWLRMEPPPGNPALMELRLTLWPGGEERVLAATHPNGAWIDWAG